MKRTFETLIVWAYKYNASFLRRKNCILSFLSVSSYLRSHRYLRSFLRNMMYRCLSDGNVTENDSCEKSLFLGEELLFRSQLYRSLVYGAALAGAFAVDLIRRRRCRSGIGRHYEPRRNRNWRRERVQVETGVRLLLSRSRQQSGAALWLLLL